MVETGHQPIPAKNDPSDQESDVHLGSFLSALLDDHVLIIRNPITLAAKAAGSRQSQLYAEAAYEESCTDFLEADTAHE